jgi:hypothetical protein
MAEAMADFEPLNTEGGKVILHGQCAIVVLYKMRSNVGASTVLSYTVGLALYHAAGSGRFGLTQMISLHKTFF